MKKIYDENKFDFENGFIEVSFMNKYEKFSKSVRAKIETILNNDNTVVAVLHDGYYVSRDKRLSND